MRKIVLLLSIFLTLLTISSQGAGGTVNITQGTNSARVRVTNFVHLAQTFERPPFYYVFIEWGDGMFDTLRASQANNWANVDITHPYAQGTVAFQAEVKVSVTPVYSEDDKPVMMRKKINVSKKNTGTAPMPTSYLPDTAEMRIFSSWDVGVQIGDTIQLVVAVNDLMTSNGKPVGADNGEVYLYFNSTFVSPVYPRSNGAFGRVHPLYFVSPPLGTVTGSEPQPPVVPGADPMIPEEWDIYNARLKWDYSNRQESRELLFFVDFVVEAEAESESFLYFLGMVTGRQDPNGNIGSAFDPDKDIWASKLYSTEVVSSRDPNGLIVFPEQVPNGNAPTTLTYTINFQNEGDAPEDNVVVTFEYPAEVDPATFRSEVTLLKREVISPNNDPGTPNFQIEKDVLVNGKRSARFTFSQANLLGLGQNLIDPKKSEGKIIFTVQTLTPTACQEISTTATINFGAESLTTDPAVVKCLDCEGGATNYVYWCLVFILALAAFLLAVWVVTLKTKTTA
ncbi:MAG: hypothetical protein R3D00_04070 [Bacteroidia bacterium]